MARNAARKRKLLKEAAQTRFVLTNTGITLAVGTFQITIRDNRRGAVTRAGNKNRIEIILNDQPVGVRINQIKSRRSSPMSYRPWLYIRWLQRASQEGIASQVNLTGS
jgi:hypothetical protein